MGRDDYLAWQSRVGALCKLHFFLPASNDSSTAVKYTVWIFHASLKSIRNDDFFVIHEYWNFVRRRIDDDFFIGSFSLPLFLKVRYIRWFSFLRLQVTIFNPHDYPDMTSGGVIDFLVSPRKHRSVELEAIMFYSLKNIIPYSLEKRNCMFEDEMGAISYTYSDCIVDCKIKDILNICGCVPFFLPNQGKNYRWYLDYPSRKVLCLVVL